MSKIRLFVMDVDGTLTDGKIYVGERGEIMKAFSVRDGYAIHDLLITAGIIPVVITGRHSKIVERRCQELGIEYLYQNVPDKLKKLQEITVQFDCTMSEIAYVGDDLNDLNCMKEIRHSGGITACPADADAKVLLVSMYISKNKGGEGAVRDVVEWILC